MIKKSIVLFFCAMFTGIHVYSQRLSISEFSGVNFSNINNSSTSGKWKSMPGPVLGISANYQLTKALSVNSGVDYTVFYYNYSSYQNPNTGPWLMDKMDPWFSDPVQDWSFSYLRLPLMISLKSPGKLSYHFSAGMFYSLLTGDNAQHNQEDFPQNDYGYLFAHGVSYQFQNRLKLSLDLKYSFGREVMIEQDNGRNAAAEICFGIGYVFGKKTDINIDSENAADSIKPYFSIKYSAGPTLAFNVGDKGSKYKPGVGFNAGLSLLYHKDKQVNFEADILYQRNSYWLKDSSSSFFYADTAQNMFYTETRTDLDYLTIPAIINFRLGKKGNFYAGFGLYAAVQLSARVAGEAYYTYGTEGFWIAQKYHVNSNINGNFYDYDAGWLFNGGFEILLYKKLKLDFNLRYNASFMNIYKNENDQVIKLKSLGINAGIIIPII